MKRNRLGTLSISNAIRIYNLILGTKRYILVVELCRMVCHDMFHIVQNEFFIYLLCRRKMCTENDAFVILCIGVLLIHSMNLFGHLLWLSDCSAYLLGTTDTTYCVVCLGGCSYPAPH